MKESRGRNNQGDQRKAYTHHGELPQHRAWNDAVRAKKLARHARRIERDRVAREVTSAVG
jgi:hypothetical protein